MATTTKGYIVNFDDMKLPELKAEAKARGIKGYSTMKKDALKAALVDSEPKPAKAESFIDGIKAAFANAREYRKNAGRKAGAEATVASAKSWQVKDLSYRLQRGSESATLTGPQSRRLRKQQRKQGTVELTYR